MHPNRQFPAHFVVHMPLCLHALCHVVCPLHSNRGCEGTVTWGMFPRGCEDTVAPRRTMQRGGGVDVGKRGSPACKRIVFPETSECNPLLIVLI